MIVDLGRHARRALPAAMIMDDHLVFARKSRNVRMPVAVIRGLPCPLYRAAAARARTQRVGPDYSRHLN
jgi:hypothetical protein